MFFKINNLLLINALKMKKVFLKQFFIKHEYFQNGGNIIIYHQFAISK